MNARTRLVIGARVIVALFIGSMAALCIAPAASAQIVVLSGSMDSNLPVSPGNTIQVGYQVSLDDVSPSSTTTTILVAAAVAQIFVQCPNRTFEIIPVNFPSQSILVPANAPTWSSSPTLYQGQATVPPYLCGGKQGTTNGAIFTCITLIKCNGNSSQNCCHNVCFRFHSKYQGRGGTFSSDFCIRQQECVSPESQSQGPCCSNKHN